MNCITFKLKHDTLSYTSLKGNTCLLNGGAPIL